MLICLIKKKKNRKKLVNKCWYFILYLGKIKTISLTTKKLMK